MNQPIINKSQINVVEVHTFNSVPGWDDTPMRHSLSNHNITNQKQTTTISI